MKNYVLKIVFVLAACMSFIACEKEVDCTLEVDLLFDVSGGTEGREVTLVAPFIEDATYQWFVNDQKVTTNETASQILYTFQGQEEKFDVCVLVTKDGCEEGTKVCEVYEIENNEEQEPTEDKGDDENGNENEEDEANENGNEEDQDNGNENKACDFALNFTIEKIGDHEVKLTKTENEDPFGFVWVINGQTIDSSESIFVYNDAQDGDQYCLMMETQECPSAKEVCKTYTSETENEEEIIEEENDKEELCEVDGEVTFDVSGGTEGKEVTLIATYYEGVIYEWFVNGEAVEAGRNLFQFLHTFKGQEKNYDVCVLITPKNCGVINSFCANYEIKTDEELMQEAGNN
ncbi:hypothetical protein [Aquimarina agarilytica]|uniref:hypothetical protein n=1 Tax=Aquimarina agarilytica TaxID=1087449 RepID=UPI000287AB87|nr:hypothetical protein [Aquimarina agarilytica]